jgi:hypothetical protein
MARHDYRSKEARTATFSVALRGREGIRQSERHPIKTATAIRRVLSENPEFAYLYKYRARYLEKKFQEVADSNAYWRLGKKYRKTI